jgi:hypothetical protein
MQMVERKIPDDIKERLRKRLMESADGLRERIRDRLKKKLLENRYSGIRSLIRERLRRRLLESGVGIRDKMRGKVKRMMLESRGSDIKLLIRERLRRRLLEGRRVGVKSIIGKRVGGRLLEGMRRNMLSESKDSLRRRLIKQWLNSKSKLKKMVLESIDFGRRGMLSEDKVDFIRERLRRRLLEGRGLLRKGLLEGRREREVRSFGVRHLGSLGERRIAMLEKRNVMLERELRRKTRLLKEAYKVVKKVNEMGGIHKIERALNLAHDTIVKIGAKLFKEAVDMISAETGVDKKRVAQLVKKVGLKEARDILKRKGSKVGSAPRTIIVEGMDSRKEQLPVLATRIAERLSKSVEAGNPGDLKKLGEAVFKKVGE